MHLLILGGTTESNLLVRALTEVLDIQVTLSLAGRTNHPLIPPVPFRIGGFGGVKGLAAWITAHQVDAIVDATHPFAVCMSSNASVACRATSTPLAVFTRPPWSSRPGDRWTLVDTAAKAASALGEHPKRAFLTLGRQDLAPFKAHSHHHYVLRAIDPPPQESLPPKTKLILARGPFIEEEERELLLYEAIDILVTKNSGGAATVGKLAAARSLGIPVVMIRRPPPTQETAFTDIDAVLAWIDAHRSLR